MSEKKSQGPLLYIYQPFSRTPSNNMQEIYTNKRKLEQETPIEEKQPENEPKRKISLAKKEIIQEPVPIEIVKSENTPTPASLHQEKQRGSFNRLKPFKELDLTERLEYLLNFPKVLPPVPCVFTTTEKNYQGYLTEFDHQNVTIQFHDQTTKTFPINELMDVIMIGIKK